MSRGVTLLELLLALIVVGLLALFAVPRLAATIASASLRQEAMALVGALDAARGAAIRLGAPSTLTLADSAYRVTVEVRGEEAVPWRRPGPGSRGVRLSGAGAPIRFGPAGIALGVANRTLTLSRAGATRQVVVSRLGRITP